MLTGTVTGYDFAGALPGLQNGVEGDAKLFNENNKRFDVMKGDAEFAVTKVNVEDGEIGGVFVANQPSDTDMGGKVPKRVLTKGIFYARVQQ
jgi:photosystem II oxygen-evolving enhancer protein 1